MADYDALFDLGVSGEYVNTVIEIPKGSMNKVEWDREKKVFILDRVEPAIFSKPANYGFIPRTTDEDGDALDTLVLTEEPLPVGIVTKATVIAVLNFIDDNEKDYKIICVPSDDRHTGNALKDFAGLTDAAKNQIVHHFTHYKDLKKPGSTVVEGWGDVAEAWRIIEECSERFSDPGS